VPRRRGGISRGQRGQTGGWKHAGRGLPRERTGRGASREDRQVCVLLLLLLLLLSWSPSPLSLRYCHRHRGCDRRCYRVIALQSLLLPCPSNHMYSCCRFPSSRMRRHHHPHTLVSPRHTRGKYAHAFIMGVARSGPDRVRWVVTPLPSSSCRICRCRVAGAETHG